jgi:non-ribosomal peptide synthetase component F
MFTSGSTGVPKGVPISHGNLAAYVANATALGGVTAEDRIIQLADLSFDISVHDMFVSWLNGAMLCSVPENATLMATRFVDELKITGWFSVPSTAGLLKQAKFLAPGSMPSMRFTFFCGEALTAAVADAWAEAAPNAAVFNLYGPTEATVAFSAYRCRPRQFEPSMIVPLGDAFHGQSIGLFEVDRPAPTQDDVGEICLSGSQVCAEYWMAPELTPRRFFSLDGTWWYRTGDLGRIDPQLGLLFAGRADHQVKIRGFRVELQEIEGVVRGASDRDLVAVIPWPETADGGATGCVAFVGSATGDAEAIRMACQRLLPDYMVPSRIIFLGEMPLNSNGKVDYLRLKNHQALSA